MDFIAQFLIPGNHAEIEEDLSVEQSLGFWGARPRGEGSFPLTHRHAPLRIHSHHIAWAQDLACSIKTQADVFGKFLEVVIVEVVVKVIGEHERVVLVRGKNHFTAALGTHGNESEVHWGLAKFFNSDAKSRRATESAAMVIIPAVSSGAAPLSISWATTFVVRVKASASPSTDFLHEISAVSNTGSLCSSRAMSFCVTMPVTRPPSTTGRWWIFRSDMSIKASMASASEPSVN